jgi:uncharacterized protein YbcI
LSETHAERVLGSSIAAAISNGVVHVVNEYTGRGPTRARTHISEEVISVVLRDTLSKGERSLVASGKVELVLAARKAYQEAMGADLIKVIESTTGREVEAFLSDNHIDPDVAIESFVLARRAPTESGAAHDGAQPPAATGDARPPATGDGTGEAT